MSSTSESTSDTSLSNELNGNAEKNRYEIEKKKRENKQNFNNKRNNESKTNATEQRDFEGMTPEIGGILALNSKRGLTKRVTLDRFQDLLQGYMSTTLKETSEVGIAMKGIKLYLLKDTSEDPNQLILDESYLFRCEDIEEQCHCRRMQWYHEKNIKGILNTVIYHGKIQVKRLEYISY